jgi:2-hydroxychromene-2-carboxylate isomerase
MKNMKKDCLMVAKKNNIEFVWNEKFPLNSLYLMRGYLSVENETKKKFFDICFDSYWKKNMDILKEENVNQILKDSGINKNKYLQKIEDQKIKDELKYLTNLAFEKDIFGAPTFVVNKKIFWGQDRLEYALDEYFS